MADLSRFLITTKWPAQHTDRLQLYSLSTPSGAKVSIHARRNGAALRAASRRLRHERPDCTGIPLDQPDQQDPGHPRSERPGGKALALFESGAILIFLAEKTGKLMPADATGRCETIQWLMFQMGGIGPMFGQVGFFHKFAGKAYDDKRPRDRYVAEAKRLLAVLNGRLAERRWIMGDNYGIADSATVPWVRNLIGFYEAGDLVGIMGFPNVTHALDVFVARPTVERGLTIPKVPASA